MEQWIPEVNMTLTAYREYLATKYYGFSAQTLLIMYSAIAVLGLLGIIGNIISIVIWTRPQVRTSSSVFLTALAVCDVVIICGNTPEYITVLTVTYLGSPAIDYINNFITPHVTCWFLPVYWTAQTASIYLTLTITLERFIAVCHPFQARVICTYKRAFKYAVAVIVVSILYNLIGFLKQTVIADVDLKGEIKSYQLEDSALARSPIFESVYELYRSWLHLILIFCLPLTCIVVLNTRIYLKLKKMTEVRRTLTASQMRENRLTMMLLYVMIEFAVCSSVNVSYKIIVMLQLSNEQLGFTLGSLLPLNTFFETLNSSSNIVTYILVGSGFREVLVGMLCCRKENYQPKGPGDMRNQELNARQPGIANKVGVGGTQQQSFKGGV